MGASASSIAQNKLLSPLDSKVFGVLQPHTIRPAVAATRGSAIDNREQIALDESDLSYNGHASGIQARSPARY